MNNPFRKKSIIFYLGELAAVCALAVLIIGNIVKGLSWDNWNVLITVMLSLGILVEIAAFIFSIDLLIVIPAFFYSAALAVIIADGAPVLADAIRQINWVGGNAEACTAYIALCVAALVACGIRAFIYEAYKSRS